MALKSLLPGAIAAAALASVATPAAAATNIFIDKAEMFNPASLYITGNAGSNYAKTKVYDAPVLFTANYGTTSNASTFTFLGFCVDIFDTISVGINTNKTENLAYHTGPLVDNGATAAKYALNLVVFAQVQKDNISKLVNYGTQLWNLDAKTDPTHNLSTTSLGARGSIIDELAGIQAAIWKIENPAFTFVGTTGTWGTATDATAITNDVTYYTSTAFLSTLQIGKIDVIFDSSLPAHQAFAFAATVPEPASWGLMILGFGLIGATLRRRRTAAVSA